MRKVRSKSKRTMSVLCTLLFAMLFFVQSEMIFAQTNEDLDDPEYWRANGYISDGFLDDDTVENQVYEARTAGTNTQTVVRLGVDVSKYQGEIDWAKAKANGIEFAFIRVGYRGSGTGELKEDPCFRQNIEGALTNGIPVGVYIFSQAITESEAVEEAYYVLERIAGYSIGLPVVIDYEFAGQGDGRLYNADLSREEMTSICRAFCETIESAGYNGMVYANRSLLRDNMYADELAKDYYIWMAHYTSATDYTGKYDFWQYTSKGDGYKYGMSDKYVDLNYWYDDGSIYTAVYEGVDYSAVFEPTFYAEKYPEVKKECGESKEQLLAHFAKWGIEAGWQGNAEFDVYAYKNRYEDLRKGFGENLRSYYLHYINYGKREGRIGTPETNVDTGVTVNPAPETNSGNNSTGSTSIVPGKSVDLRNEGGNWFYYENGVRNTSKHGFVWFEGSKFLVAGGKVAAEMNGLAQDPENPNIWYYLASGQVQLQYTGLVEYDGAWFYVNQGQLDIQKSGYIGYNGGLFYVGAGRILNEASGLNLDSENAKWYYLASGQVQNQYTGLTQYDGQWFYVINGELADTYTGSVTYDGSTFSVVNGMLQK